MNLCIFVVTAATLLSPVFGHEAPEGSVGVPLGSTGASEPGVAAGTSQAEHRVWLGADGKELPFKTDEEILEFLKTAELLDTENIPVGVTAPKRALLEQDGIQAHATFKDIDDTAKRVRLSDGTRVMELRDFYMFEYAAYELSLLLGLDNVPPTVIRKPGRSEGSLQMWIENAMTESERLEKGLQSPDIIGWRRQVQVMYLFDDLIGNVDRNAGDIVIDSDWKLWMIDHSRSFQYRFEPKRFAEVIYVERGFWERLQALSEGQIRERMGNALTGPEIEGTLERRDIIVAHIQKLIAERTEDVVLYDRQ